MSRQGRSRSQSPRSATSRAGSRRTDRARPRPRPQRRRAMAKKAKNGKGGPHTIVTRTKKKLVIVSGRSHPALAAQVAKALDSEVLPTEHRTFASGEIYTRFSESVRG